MVGPCSQAVIAVLLLTEGVAALLPELAAELGLDGFETASSLDSDAVSLIQLGAARVAATHAPSAHKRKATETRPAHITKLGQLAAAESIAKDYFYSVAASISGVASTDASARKIGLVVAGILFMLMIFVGTIFVAFSASMRAERERMEARSDRRRQSEESEAPIATPAPSVEPSRPPVSTPEADFSKAPSRDTEAAVPPRRPPKRQAAQHATTSFVSMPILAQPQPVFLHSGSPRYGIVTPRSAAEHKLQAELIALAGRDSPSSAEDDADCAAPITGLPVTAGEFLECDEFSPPPFPTMRVASAPYHPIVHSNMSLRGGSVAAGYKVTSPDQHIVARMQSDGSSHTPSAPPVVYPAMVFKC